MVSTRYLFEVAEFSCLKSMPAACVMSVNCTSGAGAAPMASKEQASTQVSSPTSLAHRQSPHAVTPRHLNLRLLTMPFVSWTTKR